ncbi:hypothetical protein MAM1_0003c00389 [Mucor ambiguus]|uniref:C2H2-type domain-containing protein n=1 Tax=Mucor ambiguus TaxID=91626 RepID=A0A0C9LZW6_9FUNG|nr:hypothetical protein MAM1_0003c00389 [Mucor ambiguus]
MNEYAATNVGINQQQHLHQSAPPPQQQQQQQQHQQQAQQSPYANAAYMSNHLPSLHEQSPYRTQQQLPPQHPPYGSRPDNGLPPPASQHQLHQPQSQQQHQQQNAEHFHQPLPSMYDSRKLFTCNEAGCSEYFDHSNGLRIHQRTVHGRSLGGGDSSNDDHIRSSQSRPYVCPYAECGKSFTQYGNLKVNICRSNKRVETNLTCEPIRHIRESTLVNGHIIALMMDVIKRLHNWAI